MRLKLTLLTHQRNALLPFNYQYPLSSAIYRIIQSADEQFALFLHNKGYGEGHRNFKLFTFSDIKTPFEKRGDRMQLITGQAELIVCFYVPRAAENFIKGLFINQDLPIADHQSKVTFGVVQVESLPPVPAADKTTSTVILQPLSPLVVGRKNALGHYDYRSPSDGDFTDCLLYNWLEKYKSVHDVEEHGLANIRKDMRVEVKLFDHPPQERKPVIKAGTPYQTKLRGYTKFRLQATVPQPLLELALGAGLGLHNAQGMGCVEVVSGEW